MAQKKKDQQVLEELHENVSAIFDQVQGSMANHKKNCVALYKLHVRTAEIVETKEVAQEKVVLVGEQEFQEVIMDMISRVLDTKKGTANVDRVVKYVGAFVKFMNEKCQSFFNYEENSTTRFVATLLNWFLQGFAAKNKNVRYRCSQLVAEMISHLGEIDEDTYGELRQSLIQRLNDKESLIRAHAVIAISKLVGSEDEDELADGEQSILQTLLDTLETDPAVEVRRAALINIPIAPSTIDALLSRTRDVDAVTRKLVYSTVIGGKVEHPRQLSITQRELIIKDGLGDREPAVRLAAGKLVAQWFDWVLGQEPLDKAKEEEADGWQGDDGGIMKGLIKFLGLFDVVGPGEVVAVDALLSILTTRREVLDDFLFPDAFWKNLTPESIVLARVFVEFCVSSKNEARLDAAVLPVVTAFAFIVQEAYNSLLSVLEEIETAKILDAGLEEQEDEEQEEELAKREVVMSELLRLALKLDYGDEIGRRRVFMVTKDMLAHPQLPPGLIERCLDVMKAIMPSERDLIRVVVEIVVELRDGEPEEQVNEAPVSIPDDQSDVSTTFRKEKTTRQTKDREDMTPQERQVADVTDIRCLMLCIAMLERVNGTFEDNSTLEGVLSDLIIPSVKRKELAMREKALVSLGLCCLIARNMALSSFQLFLSQAQNAPTQLKVQVLKVIMDLLIMYDQDFFGKSEETAKQIVDFLLQLLDAEESAEAQAVLATGLCKLLLAGIITDPKVLVNLAILYVSPGTTDNQEIRQCLAYFFPVYSYSSFANQDRVRSIFMPTFDVSQTRYEELDDDHEMISPQQIGLLMLDWTNPEKAAQMYVLRVRGNNLNL
ncbi:nuclear condensing complex subunit [Crepidotus variabilis]|uniref:Nuclear condensing complex subunit n=1 Tax=Crepidotus variabilis TaxID=179855 RepID=A0A9P6E9U8_9AGAR|nr:nuclear condensing complex subunit [Crepidotus variabilis]